MVLTTTPTNLVAQIRLGEGASLEHDRLQLQRDGATHIGKGFVWLGADARYRQTVASLGGALVRNEHEVRLQGERIECQLNGAYMPKGREQVDNLIRIRHEAPNCHSDQFYKGVVADHAHAVFAGKILVDKAAQKTNAYQKNDNLLLSDDAEVDTKPELEIYADDVKCSHGASVGDLDEAAVFYLCSRGITPEDARRMLIDGFLREAVETVEDFAARTHLLRRLTGRLANLGLEP